MGHTPSNLNFNTYLPSTTEADSNSPHSDLIGIKPIRNKECLLTPDNSHTCVCLCCLTRVCSGRLWEYDFNNSNNLILLLSSSSRPTPKDLCRCLFMDQQFPSLILFFQAKYLTLSSRNSTRPTPSITTDQISRNVAWSVDTSCPSASHIPPWVTPRLPNTASMHEIRQDYFCWI